MADPFLELVGISKSYPGVNALAEVSLSVSAGEIVGLIGENGAGKSTLMKVLGGVTEPSSGIIRINGQERRSLTVGDAIAAGIAFVHQERFEDVVFAPYYFFAGEGIFDGENRGERIDFDADGAAGFFEQIFGGMRQENDRFFRVIDDAVGQARLIFDEQGDAVFSGDVFGGYDREFRPGDDRVEMDRADAASRCGRSDGRAVQHFREREIVDIDGAAGDFLAAFFARDGRSD